MKYFYLLFLFTLFCCSNNKHPLVVLKKENNIAVSANNKPLAFIIDSLKLNKRPLKLIISKTNYTLTVFADTTLLKQFPCVFGTNPALADKLQEGDRCTPEGSFKVVSKYPSKDWVKFILLSYPTAESWKKFNAAKKNKTIPANATIGGFVGIHTADKEYDYAIDARTNWTWGCIALKHDDLLELYDVVNTSTSVEINK